MGAGISAQIGQTRPGSDIGRVRSQPEEEVWSGEELGVLQAEGRNIFRVLKSAFRRQKKNSLCQDLKTAEFTYSLHKHFLNASSVPRRGQK